MPVKKVKLNGGVGYQWGNQKVYPTRAQAEAQGRAIRRSIAKRKEKENGKHR